MVSVFVVQLRNPLVFRCFPKDSAIKNTLHNAGNVELYISVMPLASICMNPVRT